MQPIFRQTYNRRFSEAQYRKFLEDMNQCFNYHIPFRIAETPVFLPPEFMKKLMEGAHDVVQVICDPQFPERTRAAIPAEHYVPNQNEHTLFFSLDFAVCQDEAGKLYPQLIELQGFPSLFFYQDWLAKKYRQHFWLPENLTHFFNGLDSERYTELLKKVLLNGHKPENVILLELEPERQHTRIDFLCTEAATGIRSVCITQVKKSGKQLYYLRDGKKTPIHRIYNRLIFDEWIQYPEKRGEFDLTDEVEVEWAGHPNWFFQISKYTMPMLNSPFVPETHFLHQLESWPDDLENYVLKPLYSFAGSGVIIGPTREQLQALKVPSHYVLQKRIEYAPVVATPDEPAKCEVRVMYVWEPDAPAPTAVTDLVRLSKGAMIGVKYNKNKRWVGGSLGLFDPEVGKNTELLQKHKQQLRNFTR